MSSKSKSISFFTALYKSSIGRKQVIGLSGLALCGFLVSHLLGNLLLIKGSDSFNMYAHALMSNPLILVAEIGLSALFVGHILMGIFLTILNKKARPVKYQMKKSTGRGETFASKTMPISGMIILIFLITHLCHFKYGAQYLTLINGTEVRDLYRVVVEYFASPLYTAWYVFAMTVIGFHTSHGFASAFQSLGLNHPKYTPIIKKISCVYGIIIAVGFSTIAVWCYFQN